MTFLALILGKIFSNETVQKEGGKAIVKITMPDSYYRPSCIEVINEIRALYLKMFPNKPYPELLMYAHECNIETAPKDGVLCPPKNLNDKYKVSDYSFGPNVLRENCIHGVTQICEFLNKLNDESLAIGKITKGKGNKNDSVRIILNLIIHALEQLSNIDIVGISERDEPIRYINFINTLQVCPSVMNKNRITKKGITFRSLLANVSSTLMEIQSIIKACHSQQNIQDYFHNLSLGSQHYRSNVFSFLSRILSPRLIPATFSLLSLKLPLDEENKNDKHTLFDQFILEVGLKLKGEKTSPQTTALVSRDASFPVLTYGYEICSWTGRDMPVEKNKLYLKIKEGGICYTLIGVDGRRYSETLTKQDLNQEIKATTTLTQITELFPRILKAASKNGHILDIGILDAFEIDTVNQAFALLLAINKIDSLLDKAKGLAQALGTLLAVFYLCHHFLALVDMKKSLIGKMQDTLSLITHEAREKFNEIGNASENSELKKQTKAWEKNYSHVNLMRYPEELSDGNLKQVELIDKIHLLISDWRKNPKKHIKKTYEDYKDFLIELDSAGLLVHDLNIGYCHTTLKVKPRIEELFDDDALRSLNPPQASIDPDNYGSDYDDETDYVDFEDNSNLLKDGITKNESTQPHQSVLKRKSMQQLISPILKDIYTELQAHNKKEDYVNGLPTNTLLNKAQHRVRAAWIYSCIIVITDTQIEDNAIIALHQKIETLLSSPTYEKDVSDGSSDFHLILIPKMQALIQKWRDAIYLKEAKMAAERLVIENEAKKVFDKELNVFSDENTAMEKQAALEYESIKKAILKKNPSTQKPHEIIEETDSYGSEEIDIQDNGSNHAIASEHPALDQEEKSNGQLNDPMKAQPEAEEKTSRTIKSYTMQNAQKKQKDNQLLDKSNGYKLVFEIQSKLAAVNVVKSKVDKLTRDEIKAIDDLRIRCTRVYGIFPKDFTDTFQQKLLTQVIEPYQQLATENRSLFNGWHMAWTDRSLYPIRHFIAPLVEALTLIQKKNDDLEVIHTALINTCLAEYLNKLSRSLTHHETARSLLSETLEDTSKKIVPRAIVLELVNVDGVEKYKLVEENALLKDEIVNLTKEVQEIKQREVASEKRGGELKFENGELKSENGELKFENDELKQTIKNCEDQLKKQAQIISAQKNQFTRIVSQAGIKKAPNQAITPGDQQRFLSSCAKAPYSEPSHKSPSPRRQGQ